MSLSSARTVWGDRSFATRSQRTYCSRAWHTCIRAIFRPWVDPHRIRGRRPRPCAVGATAKRREPLARSRDERRVQLKRPRVPRSQIVARRPSVRICGKPLYAEPSSKWRRPESNRRHHDFQGYASRAPGSAKPLQNRTVALRREHPLIAVDIRGYRWLWDVKGSATSQYTSARRLRAAAT
jgi:hypothetical protein